VRVADPGLFALKNAIRAALVLPAAFAISLSLLGLPQMAVLAALGSMAMLVFIDFGGPWRARLRAYAVLAVAGGGLIVIGTLCSRSTALATAATALVVFAILFAGVLGGYVAAAQPAAMLAYVLSVMVPADAAAIPARLAGWGLAATLCAAATLLLWPGRPRDALRAGAAKAARALADLVEANAGRDPALADDAGGTAQAAVADVYRDFVALPNRPSGSAGPDAALARLIDDLSWLRRIATLPPGPAEASAAFEGERKAIETAVPSVLRGAAQRLDGGPAEVQLGLDGLERARLALGRTYAEQVGTDSDEAAATVALDEVFRLRQLAFRTLRVARRALQASGDPTRADRATTARGRLDAGGRIARAHASMRSVWLRNSLRGALGLTLAVFIGHLSGLEHAFWIALGTFSVLRSNALATSTTIVGALLGTLIGIVAGGALVEVIGGDKAILWAALPLAVLLAAYARRAVSFAAGQAAFSMVVLVLFNLIEPAGAQIGLNRIEDVAIGCAVSLMVGILVWPRGAAAIMRDALGNAYRSAAHYLEASIADLLGTGGGRALERAARDALESAQLLDATARDFLSQRSAARTSAGDLTRLIAGATRVRRVAGLLQSEHMLARLAPLDPGPPRLARAREDFEVEYQRRCRWYEALATAISAPGPAPQPEPTRSDGTREAEPAPVILDRTDGDNAPPPGLAIAWADRHLDTLLELEPTLAEASERLSQTD
jgi:uncharacterized membrane protein YccC